MIFNIPQESLLWLKISLKFLLGYIQNAAYHDLFHQTTPLICSLKPQLFSVKSCLNIPKKPVRSPRSQIPVSFSLRQSFSASASFWAAGGSTNQRASWGSGGGGRLDKGMWSSVLDLWRKEKKIHARELRSALECWLIVHAASRLRRTATMLSWQGVSSALYSDIFVAGSSERSFFRTC